MSIKALAEPIEELPGSPARRFSVISLSMKQTLPAAVRAVAGFFWGTR